MTVEEFIAKWFPGMKVYPRFQVVKDQNWGTWDVYKVNNPGGFPNLVAEYSTYARAMKRADAHARAMNADDTR